MIQVLPRSAGRPLPALVRAGSARAIVWPGMGAVHRTMHVFVLPPGGETRRLCHPASEAVYCVLHGSGSVNGARIATGDMWWLAAACPYQVTAGAGGLEFVGGPCPPDPALYGDEPPDVPGASAPPRIFPAAAGGDALPAISRHARLVVSPRVGARVATMNHVLLEPGEANAPHAHPASEDTIYVISGRGEVTDHESGRRWPIEAPCCVHIRAGVRHSVRATDAPMVSVGGPCPPDLAMLAPAEP